MRTLFRTAKQIAVIGSRLDRPGGDRRRPGAGVGVTVLESLELPLLRVLGREVAEVFAGLHRDHGVDLRFNAQVAELVGSGGAVTGVRLADGTVVAAEAVVAGIGIAPNTALAEAMRPDRHRWHRHRPEPAHLGPRRLRGSDVADAHHPLFGRRIRLEHWANAVHQPRAAARAMLGQQVAFDRIPYFYTDQYDLGMEYTGYVEPGGYDRVVFRGDVAGREFIAFWLAGERVLAGMNVNVWDVTGPIRELVRSGRPVDATALADPDVPLTDL